MKKYISIVLLSIYLFSFQEFRQVLKFPLLIEQFVKHEIVNNDYSFIGFFEHHYLDKSYDSDYKQDMKLPFKTYDFTAASSPLIFTVQESENYLPQKPKKIFKERNFNFFYKKDFISEYHYSVFQPPEILM